MKIISQSLLILTLLGFSVGLQAQDTIYKKDGRKTVCKVSEVYPEVVKYRLESDIYGTEKTIRTSDLALVFYENGTYDVFPTTESSIPPGESRNLAKPSHDYIFTDDNRFFEGSIARVDKENVQFQVDKEDAVYTRKLRNVAALVYSSGRHQVFSFSNIVIKVLSAQRDAFIKTLTAKTLSSASDTTQKEIASESKQISDDVTPVLDLADMDDKKKKRKKKKGKKNATSIVSTPTPKVVAPVVSVEKKNEVEKESNNPDLLLKEQENAVANKYLKNDDNTPDDAPTDVKVDFEVFEARAQEKISDLTAYLGVIASRHTDPSDANNAIALAIGLFVNEQTIVQVSSVKSTEIREFPVKTYLQRLKLLKYDNVEMDWVDINYVSNFRKGEDGNYYGTVSLKQTFKGYMEGLLVYQDTTEKAIEVVVKGIEKKAGGKIEQEWDVLLSDIGVRNTNEMKDK